jgi:hypothetical protein
VGRINHDVGLRLVRAVPQGLAVRLVSATPRTHNSDGTRARGSSNGNDRGNVEQRRRRREWLLETYAADVTLVRVEWEDGEVLYDHREGVEWWKSQINILPLSNMPDVISVEEVPTARCYRCGELLHDGTITVDRIKPGIHGGTYHRNNIRPACGKDNSSTGATVRRGSKVTPAR